MASDVSKITKFKALLGDEAAKQVLDEAERREKAAQEAGIEHKEKKDEVVAEKAKANAEKVEPVKLSELLAQIEVLHGEGGVEDDLGLLTEDPGDEAEGGDEGGGAETVEAVVKEVRHLLDKSFKEFETKIDAKLAASYVPRGKEADSRKETIQKTLKEFQDKQVDLQAQLDELNGVQPRKNKQVRGYRASQADESLTTKEVEGATGGDDPIGSFINEMLSNGAL